MSKKKKKKFKRKKQKLKLEKKFISYCEDKNLVVKIDIVIIKMMSLEKVFLNFMFKRIYIGITFQFIRQVVPN